MHLQDIPGRAFLDTSVVNFMLDFGEQIHDGAPYLEAVRLSACGTTGPGSLKSEAYEQTCF